MQIKSIPFMLLGIVTVLVALSYQAGLAPFVLTMIIIAFCAGVHFWLGVHRKNFAQVVVGLFTVFMMLAYMAGSITFVPLMIVIGFAAGGHFGRGVKFEKNLLQPAV